MSTTYFVRDPEVKWYSCACDASDNTSGEKCSRHVLTNGGICATCMIGCAELQLVAPTRTPVTVTTILSHTKMNLYPPDPPMTPFYRQD